MFAGRARSDQLPPYRYRWWRDRKSTYRRVAPSTACLRNGVRVVELCSQLLGEAVDEVVELGGRNNCASFRLRMGDGNIKCYETASSERAVIVRDATDLLLSRGVTIPRVIATKDHVVFAEWIDGSPLGHDASALRRLIAYQRQIHQVDVPKYGKSETRCLHVEWLLERLERASLGHVEPLQVRRLCRRIRALTPSDLQVRVVAPDLIPPNVVVTRGGNLVLVDNEFLGVSAGREFDVLNTCWYLFGDDEYGRDWYTDTYGRRELSSLRQHEKFWDLVLLAKFAGKRLLAGDIVSARETLRNLEKGIANYA